MRLISTLALLLAALFVGPSQAAAAAALANLPDDTVSQLRQTLSAIDSPLREALRQRLAALQDDLAALPDDLAALPAAGAATGAAAGTAKTPAAGAAPRRQALAQRAANRRADFVLLRDGLLQEISALQAQVRAAGGEAPAAGMASLAAQVRARFDQLDGALQALQTAANDTSAATAARATLAGLLRRWQAPSALPGMPVPTLSPMRPLLRPPGQATPSQTLPRYALDSLRDLRLAQGADWPPHARHRTDTLYRGDGLAVIKAAASLPPVAPDTTADCGAVAADLADDAAEVRLTPEVRALAQQLQYSPVRMLAWLHKEVAFEPYWGSLKGSLGVLQTRGRQCH